MSEYKLPEGHALVLRCCNHDMASYGGFVWPGVGGVAEAPDWSPTPIPAQGLHGWLHGHGDIHAAGFCDTSKWLVVEVEKSTIVRMWGVVKFPKGKVVFVGGRREAVEFIKGYDPASTEQPVLFDSEPEIVQGVATVGHGGVVTVGNWGVAIAGDCGMAVAGADGNATVGVNGSASADAGGRAAAGANGVAAVGDYGVAVAGYGGSASAGDYGTAVAGYRGIATAGDHGTAKAGDHGTAVAGDDGTAVAGWAGTAVAGLSGKAAAGEGGVIQIKYHDGRRFRAAVGYVEPGGLASGVLYEVVSSTLVRVQS